MFETLDQHTMVRTKSLAKRKREEATKAVKRCKSVETNTPNTNPPLVLYFAETRAEAIKAAEQLLLTQRKKFAALVEMHRHLSERLYMIAGRNYVLCNEKDVCIAQLRAENEAMRKKLAESLSPKH